MIKHGIRQLGFDNKEAWFERVVVGVGWSGYLAGNLSRS
jgi:hypothetical protein